jgi:hypothetical protein
VSNTLYLSEKFYEKAGQYNSEEFILLQMMRNEIPGLRIQIEARKKHKTAADAHLSIKAMQRYISLTKNKDDGLTELQNVIDANCGKDHPLKETRKWFKKRYPNYDSVPRFDAEGFLQTKPQEGGDEDD